MKNSVFFFFFLILINITTFSNEKIASKDINIVEIKGQYINLNIIPYDGENIILNQLSDKKKPIIKTNITKNILQYTLDNNKTSFFKTRTKFNLFIPKNTNLKYLITTINSSIFSNGVDGDFSIINSKGEITIHNAQGNINAVNTNRDIKLCNITGNISARGNFSQIFTKNTKGILNVQTTNKKIKIKNADTVGNISTSNATILAEFKNILPDSKIVTSNSNLTIKIPKNHDFNFSIFGDLIHLKGKFTQLKTNNFLTLGTSNGIIEIKELKK